MKKWIPVLGLSLISLLGCNDNEHSKKVSEFPNASIGKDQCTDPNFEINIDPLIASTFGVKKILIQNCLGYSNCFRSYYKLNECGRVIEEMPPMISSYSKFQYDEDCKLIGLTRVGWHQDDYTYFGADSVLLEISSLERDFTDTIDYQIKYRLVCENERCTFNKDGKLSVDSLGPLMYPCGIDLPGPHIARYHYYSNQLVKYIEIFDSVNQIDVELEYFYYGDSIDPLVF
ncbi:MAG: hypothetical protein ACI9J3_003174 [Parvicellaceae bacterium]|jgi:hypothetical protein